MTQPRANDTEVTGAKRTLLEWVLAVFPLTPRRRAKAWIEQGRVSVGGRVIRNPSELLGNPGDTLEFAPKAAAPAVLDQPWRIHPLVTVLYLDAALAIVNKAPGLLAVPLRNEKMSALSIVVDFVAGRLRPWQHGSAMQFRQLAAVRRAASELTVLPVHRIDRYTSGVLCLALNPQARAYLIEQFRKHEVTRQYVAFVTGRLKSARGTWQHWLGPRDHGLRRHVVPVHGTEPPPKGAVKAVTHFEVLAEFPVAPALVVSKLRFTLETGRTHQVRAQAMAAGTPIIGDRIYRQHQQPIVTGVARRVVEFDRQALHAERLVLRHPAPPHRLMEWCAPLPSDLRGLESRLRAASGSYLRDGADV